MNTKRITFEEKLEQRSRLLYRLYFRYIIWHNRSHWPRRWTLRFIYWYIRKVCGGAFHWLPYGPGGRYVVIVTEDEYSALQESRYPRQNPD